MNLTLKKLTNRPNFKGRERTKVGRRHDQVMMDIKKMGIEEWRINFQGRKKLPKIIHKAQA